MSDSLTLRFLYRTVPGRAVLKLLTAPGLSRAAGRFLDAPASKVLIPLFRHSYGISTEGILIPGGGFESFNAFFSRKRAKVVFDESPEAFCAPCDALLSCFPITEDSVFHVKHTRYSLAELLGDAALAEQFRGGTALIFRLTPAHYHRYHFNAAGTIRLQKYIPGVLHTVQPIAGEVFPIFVQNSRAVCVLDTPQFGTLAQLEVGALLVGKIKNLPVQGAVTRGMEKGCFEYGGSTIIMLVQQGKAVFDAAFFTGGEQPVVLGQRLN